MVSIRSINRLNSESTKCWFTRTSKYRKNIFVVNFHFESGFGDFIVALKKAVESVAKKINFLFEKFLEIYSGQAGIYIFLPKCAARSNFSLGCRFNLNLMSDVWVFFVCSAHFCVRLDKIISPFRSAFYSFSIILHRNVKLQMKRISSFFFVHSEM